MDATTWLGQKLAAQDAAILSIVPASDAPEVSRPGHRRGENLFVKFAHFRGSAPATENQATQS